MSDFLSFERDLGRARHYGQMAATAEADRPGIHSASVLIRDEFRKAVLSRYVLSNYVEGAYADKYTTNYVKRMRLDLNQAYYSQSPYVHARKGDVRVLDAQAFDPPAPADVMPEFDLTGTASEMFGADVALAR